MPKKELIDITGQIVAETERAIKLDDGTKIEWLPRQFLEIEEKSDGLVEVTMPVWLATDKGFI